MKGKIPDTLNTLLSHQKTIMTPAKWFVFIIAVLILGACSDELIPVEAIDPADPTDYASIYLEKSKTRQLDITLEEFIALAKEQESIRLSKSGFLTTTSTPPVWESDYGTKLPMGDDYSMKRSLGFNFVFFRDYTYSRVWINSNGNLTFNGSNGGDFTIPVSGRAILAPLAGDLTNRFFGGIYFNRLGVAPNRRFVVTWDDVPEWGWYGSYTFQVTLFEGSNQILLSYNGLYSPYYNAGRFQIGLRVSYSNKYKLMIATDQASKDFDGRNIYLTPQNYKYTLSAIPNSPPEANAGPDQTKEWSGTGKYPRVRLTSSSTDPDGDGDIFTYKWTLDGNVVSTKKSFRKRLPLGIHTFTLKVSDLSGEFDTDDVTITIVKSNKPPVANAGPDQTLECQGETTQVTLNGSGYDPDGDDLSNEWTLDGNVVSTAASFDSDLSLGTHTFTLKVTDPDGESDSDDVDITIEDTGSPDVTFELKKDKLWPANHKMVLVASGISASDICCETLLTIEVTSNEPINGNGAGNTEADWDVIDNGDGTFDVLLRAERAGDGSDRIYIITANAEDCSNNLTTVSKEVIVPHDKGKKK